MGVDPLIAAILASPEWREKERADRKAQSLAEQAERFATGHTLTRLVHHFWRRHFQIEESRMAPKSISQRDSGTGTPSRGADAPSVVFLCRASAVLGECQQEERERVARATQRGVARAVPVEGWLREHYLFGRPFWALAERAGVSQAFVQARFRAWHRITKRAIKDGLVQIDGERVRHVPLTDDEREDDGDEEG